MRIANWVYAIPLRLRSVLRHKKVEQELDEELQYHIEQLTKANVAKGMSPDAARYAAMGAMQGIEQCKEECRDKRGVNLLENLARDLHYALRMMRKSPAAAIASPATREIG